jgi:aspartate racemase
VAPNQIHPTSLSEVLAFPAESSSPGIVGILGGMGPMATIDFMQKLIAHTPATKDQEHVPVIVASIPQIPDRTAAYQGLGPSPLGALIASGRRLIEAGAAIIVVPCNTAHLWFEPLERALSVPMLHIVDAALERAMTAARAPRKIGLLATAATVDSGLYQGRAAARADMREIEWVVPTAEERDLWVTPGIAAVKAGRLQSATGLLAAAAAALVRRDAEAIVMGCTEIPVVLRQDDVTVPLVDATDALAARVVSWSKAERCVV